MVPALFIFFLVAVSSSDLSSSLSDLSSFFFFGEAFSVFFFGEAFFVVVFFFGEAAFLLGDADLFFFGEAAPEFSVFLFAIDLVGLLKNFSASAAVLSIVPSRFNGA